MTQFCCCSQRIIKQTQHDSICNDWAASQQDDVSQEQNILPDKNIAASTFASFRQNGCVNPFLAWLESWFCIRGCRWGPLIFSLPSHLGYDWSLLMQAETWEFPYRALPASGHIAASRDARTCGSFAMRQFRWASSDLALWIANCFTLHFASRLAKCYHTNDIVSGSHRRWSSKRINPHHLKETSWYLMCHPDRSCLNVSGGSELLVFAVKLPRISHVLTSCWPVGAATIPWILCHPRSKASTTFIISIVVDICTS